MCNQSCDADISYWFHYLLSVFGEFYKKDRRVLRFGLVGCFVRQIQ